VNRQWVLPSAAEPSVPNLGIALLTQWIPVSGTALPYMSPRLVSSCSPFEFRTKLIVRTSYDSLASGISIINYMHCVICIGYVLREVIFIMNIMLTVSDPRIASWDIELLVDSKRRACEGSGVPLRYSEIFSYGYKDRRCTWT
jgi:hypothetical protein